MAPKDQRKCVKGCCAGRYEKLAGHHNPGIKNRKKTARHSSRKMIFALVTAS